MEKNVYNLGAFIRTERFMTLRYKFLSSAGPRREGGWVGGHVPPPPRRSECPIKKNNNKTHDMICVIRYCLTCDLDNPDDDGLPTILLKERVAVGAQTGL